MNWNRISFGYREENKSGFGSTSRCRGLALKWQKIPLNRGWPGCSYMFKPFARLVVNTGFLIVGTMTWPVSRDLELDAFKLKVVIKVPSNGRCHESCIIRRKSVKRREEKQDCALHFVAISVDADSDPSIHRHLLFLFPGQAYLFVNCIVVIPDLGFVA